MMTPKDAAVDCWRILALNPDELNMLLICCLYYAKGKSTEQSISPWLRVIILIIARRQLLSVCICLICIMCPLLLVPVAFLFSLLVLHSYNWLCLKRLPCKLTSTFCIQLAELAWVSFNIFPHFYQHFILKFNILKRQLKFIEEGPYSFYSRLISDWTKWTVAYIAGLALSLSTILFQYLWEGIFSNPNSNISIYCLK